MVRAPSWRLALTEIPRALVDRGTLTQSRRILATAPRGDGHPVLVLPGFIAGDGSTATLRRYLASLGHDARAWGLGRNLGPRSIGSDGEILVERLRSIHERTGRKVSLVGWSLGGVMARIVASRAPDTVRQVVTLGSPFGGSPRATNVWRAYELLTGHRVGGHDTRRQLAEASVPLPMPTTAIYSRQDGIVAWQLCRETGHDRRENIEVGGSHLGLAINPAALYAIADRLAQSEGDWHRFDTVRAPLAYPAPSTVDPRALLS